MSFCFISFQDSISHAHKHFGVLMHSATPVHPISIEPFRFRRSILAENRPLLPRQFCENPLLSTCPCPSSPPCFPIPASQGASLPAPPNPSSDYRVAVHLAPHPSGHPVTARPRPTSPQFGAARRHPGLDRTAAVTICSRPRRRRAMSNSRHLIAPSRLPLCTLDVGPGVSKLQLSDC